MSYATTPIYSFPLIQQAVLGGATRMITWACTDSLSSILAAGYINPIVALGHPVYANDVFVMTYNSATGPVTGFFTPVIASTGVVTLIPFEQGNILRFNTAFNHTNLASAAKVTIIPAVTGQSFQPIDVKLAGIGGTNFSGASGDRLLQLSDGTNVFTLVPAATLQTLTNSVWGSTAVPAPASVPFSQASAAGSALSLSYSGGTTDYTAGAAVLSTAWLRVA